MSGRIPRQFIDDLLVRVDIVDLIDTHLPLKKSGNNYTARCPFHSEKTPSFSVSRNRQIYHCFGCGASGNALSFLMEYSHLSFPEAVEDLAAFLGVDLVRENTELAFGNNKETSAKLFDTLEQIACFYAKQLHSAKGKKALDYLKRRGLSTDISLEFNLGYAPQSWDSLITHFDRNTLIDAGMLVVKEDGQTYDRFRDRLMFPIRDKRKRVIGFGGRVLDESLPKYLNSPETATFSKSKELYGLYELLEKKLRPEKILVVEGYLDVIALTQHGINNAVATLGTATSKTQIDLLFRFAAELVLCFDGDNAGRQAAWKAVDAALPCLRDGKSIKIMLLPQNEDPDSLIRAEGANNFKTRIDNAQFLSDYFFESLSETLDLKTIEGRAQLLTTAKPAMEKIPSGFFKDMMQHRLSELTNTRLVDVTKKQSTLKPQLRIKPSKISPHRPSLARKILALLIQHPHLESLVLLENFNLEDCNFAGQELLKDILQKIALEKPENSAILMEAYRDSPHEKTIKALANLNIDVPEGGEKAEFSGALRQLLRQTKQDRLGDLLAKESREGLSHEEKQVLRELLKQRV